MIATFYWASKDLILYTSYRLEFNISIFVGNWTNEYEETLNCTQIADTQVNCWLTGIRQDTIPGLRIIKLPKLDGSIITYNGISSNISDTSLTTNENGDVMFDWGNGIIWTKGNVWTKGKIRPWQLI